LIISISGLPGAGKSAVAKSIAEKLELKHFYMGGVIRQMAKEKGMTLAEFYSQSKDVDKLVDDYLIKLGKEQNNFLVESRTAFHFIPHSIKIYLDVDKKVVAERIFKETKEENDRNEKKYESVEEALKSINDRLEMEAERYAKLYDLDVHDKAYYDIILNTTDLTIEEVKAKLLNLIEVYYK